MKKITITLLLLIFVLRVVGQQMNTSLPLPKGANYTNKPVKNMGLNFNTNPNAASRSASYYDSSGWFNYGDAIGSLYGIYTDYYVNLWPDTNVIVNVDSAGFVIDTMEPSVHAIGNLFDAYSPTLQAGYKFQFPLVPDSSYTLDSLAIKYLYSRNDTSKNADTLMVYCLQALPGNPFKNIAYDIPVTYFTGSFAQNFNADTVFVPLEHYDYKTNALQAVSASLTTLKIPLTENDTSVAFFNAKKIALPTPMLIKAGNLVATAFAFVPGFHNINKGGNISDSGNVFSFQTFQEVNNGFPYYFPGDNGNVSSIVENTLRYNVNPNGWDGVFLPSDAFGVDYQLVDHQIFYHIEFNIDTVSGIQPVNSLVAYQIIYPNPSSDQSMLAYTLKTGASVVINVYDITGRVITSMNEGNVIAGKNQQVIDTHNLPDGVYLVSIIANGISSVSKLVVAR
jgi:hypothetical protein